MQRISGTLFILVAVVVTGCAERAQEPQANVRPTRAELMAAARPAPEKILAAAEAGDVRAAYIAYQQAKKDEERRKWICVAANRDFHRAQSEIARLHWWSPGDPPTPFAQDGFRYCVWSVIAAHRQGPPDENLDKQLKSYFPKVELWRVNQLALAWKPNPAKCENLEDSEYYSIPGVAKLNPAPLNVMAEAKANDAWAAYLAYKQATTDAERRRWLCIAAHGNRSEAHAEIARLHSLPADDPPGLFERDLTKAYIWSVIAVHRHTSVEDVERRLGWMVKEGKWRATALALSWRPDPSICENIKDSDYFSIP